MTLRFSGVSLAAACFLAAGTLPASAMAPKAVAEALGNALTEGSNVAATYESAEADGADVVIRGFTFSRTSGDDTARFNTVVVESPTEGGNGVFESPAITFTDGSMSGKTNGSVASASMTNATILDPAEGKKNGFGGSILFDTAEIADIHLKRQAEPGEVSIGRVELEAGNVVDNLAQDSKGRAEGITLSPDLFPSGIFAPASFGYDHVALDVSWDSSRDVSAKTMTIREFTVQVHDGGELKVTGVMGNLPDPRVLDDAGAASKASKAEVHQLTVQYLDNSLAGRVLDALAKRQGISRTEYTQQLTAALPFLLLTLNNPAFQSQVTAAIKGFLQDPRSLTISLDPDSPVSGSDILSLLRSNPGTVPDRLKASVTANAIE